MAVMGDNPQRIAFQQLQSTLRGPHYGNRRVHDFLEQRLESTCFQKPPAEGLHSRERGKVGRQTALRPLAFRDVLDHGEDANELALCIPQRGVGPLADDGAPVLRDVLVDAVGRHVAFGQAAQNVVHLRARGIGHNHAGMLAPQFRLRITKDALRRRIHLAESVVLVVDDAADRHPLPLHAQPLFALPQRLRGRLALGGQHRLRLRLGGPGTRMMHCLGDPGDHRTGQHEDHQAQRIGRL